MHPKKRHKMDKNLSKERQTMSKINNYLNKICLVTFVVYCFQMGSFYRNSGDSYVTLSLNEISLLKRGTPMFKSLYILDKFFYANPRKKMKAFCSKSTIDRFYIWKDTLSIKQYSKEFSIKRSDLYKIIQEINLRNSKLSDLYIFCLKYISETSKSHKFLSKVKKLKVVEKKKILKKKIDCSIIKTLSGSSILTSAKISKLEEFLPSKKYAQEYKEPQKLITINAINLDKPKINKVQKPISVNVDKKLKKPQELTISMSELESLRNTTQTNRSLYILDKYFVNNSRKRMKNFCSKNTLTKYFFWKSNLNIDPNSKKIQINRSSLREILDQIRYKDKSTVVTKDLYPFYILAAAKEPCNTSVFSKKVPKKRKGLFLTKIPYLTIKKISGIYKIKRNKINTLRNYIP